MGFGMAPDDDTPMLFLPGVIVSMWGGAVRSLADQLGIELDDIRQRSEPWFTPERIECKMATVEPGHMAAVRFAVEGVRNGEPVITMEHVTRLTASSSTGLGLPTRESDRRPSCRGRGGPASGSQYACFASVARLDRRRLHLDRGTGGQRDRLGLLRSQGIARVGRCSAGRCYPWPHVVTPDWAIPNHAGGEAITASTSHQITRRPSRAKGAGARSYRSDPICADIGQSIGSAPSLSGSSG